MSASTDLHALLRHELQRVAEQLAASGSDVGERGAGESGATPLVTIRRELALVPAQVDIEPSLLQGAVRELVRNALSAMPTGGVLTVRTEHVEAVGAELGPVPPLTPGRFMRVTVQDTGHGMDEGARAAAVRVALSADLEAHERGLARVISVLRTVGGSLWLDSARSLGTRAFLYLPVRASTDEPLHPTVLLVEDEATVRSVVRRMLVGQGFLVREARDGDAALRLWRLDREAVRVVVTDVVMPVMGGRDLARELRSLDPALPVLFMSAYAGDEPGLLDGVAEPRRLLAKPFTNDALLQALRALLEPPA